MEKYIDFLKSLSVEAIGGILGTILLLTITALYRFPKYLFYRLQEKKNESVIKKVVKVRKILRCIFEESGAIYVQIVKYHNTGKHIKPNSLLKQTIIWEEIRYACSECPIHEGGHLVSPMQDQIQDVTVTSGWSEVIYNTIANKNQVNYVRISQLSPIDKKAWDDKHIELYKEIHILDTSTGIYVLGISMCPNSNKNYPDKNIFIARDKLKNLLW